MEANTLQQSKMPGTLDGEPGDPPPELNQGELLERLRRIDQELGSVGQQARPLDHAGQLIERRTTPRPQTIRVPAASEALEPTEQSPPRRVANSLLDMARRALLGSKNRDQPRL